LSLALALTLGWKVAARLGQFAMPSEPDARLRVAEFLTRQHFAVSVSAQVEEGRPMVSASAGPCRMLIVSSPATGSDRDLTRRLVSGADRFFVVFRGQVYPEQPTWLTVPDHLWSRLRRELGWDVQATPVLSVIASASCEAERLPWNELS
jgi:hypothetical protein